MSNRNQPAFVIYACAVATHLRKVYGLTRLQAEWVGFRCLSSILLNYNGKSDAKFCAGDLYRRWPNNLEREFNSL